MRGFYDEKSEKFAIEFRYIGERAEGLIEVREKKEPEICLFVGKHSSRLYRIEIDVKKLGADTVELQLMVPKAVRAAEEAIGRLGATVSRETNRISDRFKYEPVNAAAGSRRRGIS